MFKWSRATVNRMNGSGENGFMRTARVPYKVLYALLFTLLVVIVVLLLPSERRAGQDGWEGGGGHGVFLIKEDYALYSYNDTYPLTPPNYIGHDVVFRVAVVADQDEASKQDDVTWHSWLRTGYLTLLGDGTVKVKWDEEMTELRSHISEKGRGVELSELVAFNGHLYTVDDRSGIVFEVLGGRLVPWVILEDGPGSVDKGFKAEWMTVKNQQLHVGGLGKPWTTSEGVYVNDHPQYVKVVSALGHVEHRPWAKVYQRLKETAGITEPGYVIHESACWSAVHRKWFFLPRRASKEIYNDVEDERRATNLLISADEAFADIQVSTVGVLNPLRGFSSFKFVPHTRDSVIVAIKSEENKGKIASYISVFDLEGTVRMPEEKIADLKFEGIEFI